MLNNVRKTLGYFRLSLLITIVAGFIFTPTIYSQSWGNTISITTIGNNLYTVETNGNLYRTNLLTGIKTAEGSANGALFLFTDGTNLYSIASNGYPTNHTAKRTIGPNNWMNTRLLATDLNYFYTIETNGSLFRTDFKTLVKTKIDTKIGTQTASWSGAKLIFADAGVIAIIGYPQIYAVDSTNGTTIAGGPVNLLSSSRLGVYIKGVDGFFTIDSSGLYRTSNLVKTRVGNWTSAKFLFSFGTDLWVINFDGRLYRIALSNGGYSKVFPAPTPTPTPTPTSTPTPEVNLAFGKTATQSTNLSAPYVGLGLASLAVDGNTDGHFFNNKSVASTNGGGVDPWWEVDLGTDYNVNKIQIWNRTDCCKERLTNYQIWTKTLAGGWEEFTPGLKTYTPGETYPLTFSGSKRARIVRVQISGGGILGLAEVKVFGTPASPVAISTPTSPTPTPTPTPTISDGKAVSSEEEQLWAEVEKANTVKAYQKYLTEFKNGKYAKTAQTRIDLSSDTSATPTPTPSASDSKAVSSEEEQLWADVEKANTVKAYQLYLTEYKNGKYAKTAQRRIDLSSDTTATPTPTPTPIATPTPLPKVSADDEFWNKIKDSNRVEDFEVYLKAFPNGDHKADAMLNISRLKPEKKEPEKEPEPEKPQKCIVNGVVNLREDPNNKGKKIGTLNKGRTVVWIEEDGDWDRVGEIRNGRIVSLGWVFHTYLDCDP